MALLHGSIADAVSAIDDSGRPGSPMCTGRATPRARPRSHVAAHESRRAVPGGPSWARRAGARRAGRDAGRRRRAQGMDVGRRVAVQALAARANDGANAAPPPYWQSTTPGDFRRPPGVRHAGVHTLGGRPPVRAAHRRRPAPARAVAAGQRRRRARAGRGALARLRDEHDAHRRPDVVARFWAAPIQNYWNEIAQTAVLAHHASLDTSARTFAALNLTLADATIAFYDAKYAYRVWRPITAIRAAEATRTARSAGRRSRTRPPTRPIRARTASWAPRGGLLLGAAFGDRFELRRDLRVAARRDPLVRVASPPPCSEAGRSPHLRAACTRRSTTGRPAARPRRRPGRPLGAG